MLRISSCTAIVILVCACLAGRSQLAYRLNFHIEDLGEEKLWLVFYYGDQQIRIDTVFTDPYGNVSFELDDNDEVGMYRLEKDRPNGLDFLFNKENLDISVANNFGLESIVASGSIENKIFFEYYRLKYDLGNRLDILGGFLKYYPPSDPFYFEVAAHAEVLSGQYQQYLDSILTAYPGLMVSRIVRFDQLPDIRPGELDEASRDLYRAHYFDGVDLKDTLILNTPLLPVKIIDYLSLYVQPGASRESQESLFMQAVDSLMKFTEGGMKVREMIVNYLINGFQAYGFEHVLTHLVENYVLGQACVSDQQEEKLRLRIEGFKKLAVGTTAPDFEILGADGSPVRLSGYKGKKVVLIFWAGNCPHCKAILPELNNLYAQYRGMAEFIGISVDDSEDSWRDAVRENHLLYPNAAELKGWDGRTIQEYYVYATPTFFVLDSAGRIAAKPTGVGELRSVLEK